MSYLASATLVVGQEGAEPPVVEARRKLWCVRCNRSIIVGEQLHQTAQPTFKAKEQEEHPCCQR